MPEKTAKKQVVFIHGATAFSAYDAFLGYLRSVPIRDPFGEPEKRWKDTLRPMLGEEFEVCMPQMPNKQNAKYEEWRIWFERHLPFLRDDVVLIGHSQGGYFLAKFLAEQTMPVTVKALYLVAAPAMKVDFEGEDGGDFTFDMSRFSEAAAKIPRVYIFHSENDLVVPFTHAEAYIKQVPNATLVAFKDRGHFVMEEFPELVSSIKNLWVGD